jgi:PhoPQ-activated pathogenicity-related protein
MPDLHWKFEETTAGLALVLQAEPRPSAVRAWLARSETRDFRDSAWRATPLALRKGRYRYWLERPAQGFRAIYAEAVFGRGQDQVFLSSLPMIAGPGP